MLLIVTWIIIARCVPWFVKVHFTMCREVLCITSKSVFCFKNRCRGTRDIISFIPCTPRSCQNLATTLPTMQHESLFRDLDVLVAANVASWTPPDFFSVLNSSVFSGPTTLTQVTALDVRSLWSHKGFYTAVVSFVVLSKTHEETEFPLTMSFPFVSSGKQRIHFGLFSY